MNLESELRADNGPPLGAELGTIEILPEGSAHFEGYSCPGPGNLEVNPERTIEAGAAACDSGDSAQSRARVQCGRPRRSGGCGACASRPAASGSAGEL